MKRLGIWLPAAAGLVAAIALSTACSGSKEATATSGATATAPVCDLKAASASAAETALAGCGAKWIDANVAINQLQSVGTHNSYKIAIPDVEMAIIKERNPNAAVTLDYSHETLAAQLDKGARQL